MYTLNISGHHVQSGAEVQDLIKEKMDHLSRVNQQITAINVILNSEKHEKNQLIVEATVHIPGHDIFATARTDKQLSAALDLLCSKLEKQLIKYKSKQTTGKGKVHKLNVNDMETLSEKEKQAEFNALADRNAV
ncbi:ribosome-associated translation inhibitor RaiA [Marinomonas agarivorans]|nr:ribosome-associated translation inhibitor RaiA [Marinomonas agarivorans]